MAVQLRIKGTNKLLHMNSGKYTWSKLAHAKAALKTSGICHSSMRDVWEAFPDDAASRSRKGYRYNFEWATLEHLIDVVDLVEEDKAKANKVKFLIERLEDALYSVDPCNPLIAEAAAMRRELSNG